MSPSPRLPPLLSLPMGSEPPDPLWLPQIRHGSAYPRSQIGALSHPNLLLRLRSLQIPIEPAQSPITSCSICALPKSPSNRRSPQSFSFFITLVGSHACCRACMQRVCWSAALLQPMTKGFNIYFCSFPDFQSVLTMDQCLFDAGNFGLKLFLLKEMDLDQQADNLGANGGGLVWPGAMSSYMLQHLAQLVSSGTKTSTGFKQVHLNGCARALKENMGYHVTGTQVGNHLRKWKKTYGKIQKLKNLSGALWDEETCTISLEREHYLAHIRIHRDDAKYLNCPIEHYHEMATIFGNSLATGAYAKGASDPLASEVTATANASQETKDGAETNEQGGGSPLEADEMTFSANTNGAGSSGTKPPPAKKHKVAAVEDPNIAMVSIMSEGLGNLAAAIEKVVKEDDGIPEGLYDDMMSIPGFDEAHLDHYHAYLCEHPSLARRFYNMRLSSKMVWVARYIKEHLCGPDE